MEFHVMQTRPGQSAERVMLSGPNGTPPPAAEAPPAAPQAPPPEAPAQPPAPAPPADQSPEALEAAVSPDAPPPGEADGDDTITVPEHQRRRPTRNRDAEDRIRQLTADKYELARERDAHRAEIQALLRLVQPSQGPQDAQPPGASPPQAPAPPAPRPRMDDYDSQAEWIEALTDWKADLAAEKQVQAALGQRDAQTAEERQRTLIQRLGQRLTQGRQTFADFDLAIQDPSNVYRDDLIPIVQEVAVQHEHGHLLMYHLATHPDVRAALDDRTAQGARRFLESVAQQLGAPPAPPPARHSPVPAGGPAPVPPASPPVTPVTPGSVPVPLDPSGIAERKGSLRDYMRARPYRP